MLEKLPPFDLDAEEAVLGSLLIDSDAMKVLDLGAEDFFSEQNQYVFGACCNLAGRGVAINQITVAHELVNKGRLDEAGGAAYLSHLVAIVPTSLHIKHYAGIVADCAYNRRLISAAGQIEAVGYANGTPEDGAAKVADILKDVNSTVKDNSVLTPEYMAGYATDELLKMAEEKPYIKTGIASLDRAIGGLLKETFILAARTSIGKTTLALQIARNVAETRHALYVSIEMSKKQVMIKNVSALSGISEKALSLGRYKVDGTDGKKIAEAIAALSKLNLCVADGNRTTSSIRRLIDRQLYTGCDLVVIDYLGRITGSRGSQYEKITGISHELSIMQKDYDLPFLILAQLNRDIEKRDKDDRDPKLIDLRDSGDIESDADTVGILVRPGNLFLLKNRLRGGETGVVEMGYNTGIYY